MVLRNLAMDILFVLFMASSNKQTKFSYSIFC